MFVISLRSSSMTKDVREMMNMNTKELFPEAFVSKKLADKVTVALKVKEEKA